MFPHLQTRRPRHSWAEALGKRSNQESSSYLLILGFERDVIELAFSEAPFGSSLRVRGRVDWEANREVWAAGSRPRPPP